MRPAGSDASPGRMFETPETFAHRWNQNTVTVHNKFDDNRHTFKKLLPRTPNAHNAQCQHANIEASAVKTKSPTRRLSPLSHLRFMSVRKRVPDKLCKGGLERQRVPSDDGLFFCWPLRRIPQMVILIASFEGPEDMRRTPAK